MIVYLSSYVEVRRQEVDWIHAVESQLVWYRWNLCYQGSEGAQMGETAVVKGEMQRKSRWQ